MRPDCITAVILTPSTSEKYIFSSTPGSVVVMFAPQALVVTMTCHLPGSMKYLMVPDICLFCDVVNGCYFLKVTIIPLEL